MPEKHDRLTAFLNAFALRAEVLGTERATEANLFVAVLDPGGSAALVVFHAQGGPAPEGAFALIVAARIDFGGTANPLLGALPPTLTFAPDETPALRGIADQIVDEARTRRCGGHTVADRLCEVIVVLAMRRAIDAGTVNGGLLAGLAHPILHPSLVALHDAPARAWRIDDLARIVGLSRSHFMARFSEVVGESPSAYLTSWRLALGRMHLLSGRSVKEAAGRVGFGSAAAFSRAFSRKYGYPPAVDSRGLMTTLPS